MNLLKIFVNLFHFNRTNWKAVTLCFVAASIFWLFTALNKSYSTNIRFPLQFEFDRSKFAPAEQLPQTILINVKGTGWDLFRKYFGVKVPKLTIPIERPAETKKIVASTLPMVLTSQLGNVQINHIVLDTIRLQLEPLIYRKVPIVVDTNAIDFKGNFGRTSRVVITPDSVDLSGPMSAIHDTPDPIVLQVSDKRIDANYQGELEVLVSEPEYIQRNPPVVEVRFEVGDFVPMERRVAIEPTKLPWGYVPQQDSITFSCRVPVKNVAQFKDANVRAVLPTIPEDAIKRGETKSFMPMLLGLTPFIEVTQADSIRVKHF